MVKKDTLKFLDTTPNSHQNINILGMDASFNIDEISAHYTFTQFENAQQVSALHISFNSYNSSINLCIWQREICYEF